MGGAADASMASPAPELAEEPVYANDGATEMDAAPGSSKRLRAGFDPAGRDERLAQAPGAPPPPPPPDATEPTDPGAPAQPAPSKPDAQIAGPLLIYTAHLGMSVFETAKALDTVEQMARDAGGYLVIRNNTTITVRVPASKFDSVLAETMKLGDVLQRNVEVRDVTEEYYDLQTRLRNKEAVLERLKELLKRADQVEDALKVEAELARVTAEVEQMKGRLKLLRELIAFSTITVEFAPRETEHIDSNVNLPFPWLGGLGLSNLMSL
jgi:hypothetical protein